MHVTRKNRFRFTSLNARNYTTPSVASSPSPGPLPFNLSNTHNYNSIRCVFTLSDSGGPFMTESTK